MSSSFDFDRRLTAWLDEQAPTYVPEDLAALALSRTRRTRQLPGWVTLERWIPMETRYKFGAVPKTALILTMLAVLLALFSAIAVGQQPSPKLPPPLGVARNGLIAFDDGGDIYVVNPDGSGRSALTSGPDLETSPEWSQDGTRIAYFSQQQADSTLALKVMSANGTDVRTLVEGVTLSPVDIRVSWSHDGRFIAYSDSAGQPGQEVNRIMVAPVAGGEPVEIVSPGEAPTWSPDDRWIGYRSGGRTKDLATEPVGLSVIGADAAGKRLIDGAATDNPWAYAFPQWSLDGERIAYHAGLPGHISDIFVAAVDGSGTEAIGDLTENLVWPVWSPDGARIAYSGPATSDGMSQIGVMDADGTNIETLDHPSLGCNCAFGWSPDGTKVIASQDAPVAGAGAHPALMVIDVTGSAPVGVIPSEGVTSQEASWQRLAP